MNQRLTPRDTAGVLLPCCRLTAGKTRVISFCPEKQNTPKAGTLGCSCRKHDLVMALFKNATARGSVSIPGSLILAIVIATLATVVLIKSL